MAQSKIDFSALSPDERIQLAEDLWDSLAGVADTMPLPEAHAQEIDRRVAAYRQDGDRGAPWQAVLDEIDARLSKKRDG
jgi:putative addiction module component (TIGR02574 family)